MIVILIIVETRMYTVWLRDHGNGLLAEAALSEDVLCTVGVDLRLTQRFFMHIRSDNEFYLHKNLSYRSFFTLCRRTRRSCIDQYLICLFTRTYTFCSYHFTRLTVLGFTIINERERGGVGTGCVQL